MKVCIDAGHGGTAPGAIVPGVEEADLVLPYSRELGRQLVLRGHDVLYTRQADESVGLTERAQLANAWGADTLVSLHANSSTHERANGAWVIYDDASKPTAGPALATGMFNHLAKIPGMVDADPEVEVYADRTAWVGHRDLTVISKAEMPAVLVELGFLTNRLDLEQLRAPQTAELVANALADALEEWGRERGLVLGWPDLPEPEVEVPWTDADLPTEYTIPAQVRPILQRPAREVVTELAAPDEPLVGFVRRVLTRACDDPFVRDKLGLLHPMVCWGLQRLLDLLT